jgi:signal transduction histidine kinase/DNA-binding CsgD family transcriptional regulator
VFIPFSALVLEPFAGLSGKARFLLQIGALAVVPFVFAAGILCGGFARTAQIEELGLWLASAQGRRTPVRDALAAALGDESLDLCFPSGHDGQLLDDGGRVVPLGRYRATVSVDGAEGAVIAYDATLIADPSLVRQAGRVVALALERERLTVELLAGRRELLESRARLVQVADDERRRFAQDLHDLLQSRLVLATLRAGTLGSTPGLDAQIRRDADALRQDLTDAIGELRRLVHGVMPALLLERGLFAAAEDLLDRSPIPVDAQWGGALTELPAAVSTGAYLILAEATANAVRHSRASEIRVRVERAGDALTLDFADDGVGGATSTGAGLRGMRDRVDVLDGHFELVSRATRAPDCWSDCRAADHRRGRDAAAGGPRRRAGTVGLPRRRHRGGRCQPAGVGRARASRRCDHRHPDATRARGRRSRRRDPDPAHPARRRCAGALPVRAAPLRPRADRDEPGRGGLPAQGTHRRGPPVRRRRRARRVRWDGARPRSRAVMMARAAHKHGGLDRLTARQRDVLELIAQGRTNAAIAARLNIAEKSVVQHASRIYDDLGLEVNSVDHRRVMAVIRFSPVDLLLGTWEPAPQTRCLLGLKLRSARRSSRPGTALLAFALALVGVRWIELC